MTETIIESVLSGKIDVDLLLKWLDCDTREDTLEDCVLLCCNKSEFVAHFIAYLRNQTDSILRSNRSAIQLLQHQTTPDKSHNPRRKHRRSISDPTSDDRTKDSLAVKPDRLRSHESPSKNKKRTGRRVKTKLFTEEKITKEQSVSSDESRLSIGTDKVASSTPMKNGRDLTLPLTSPVTPNRSFKEHDVSPKVINRHSRSHEKSCLGDYLATAQKSTKKKKAKNTSNDDADVKLDLDVSNWEQFPVIGVKKSSSLRSDRKRIKPTNIDTGTSRKSFPLNCFSSECFQQSSPIGFEESFYFKMTLSEVSNRAANSFEDERNILKQERNKLMEKFNILNTSAASKKVKTSQIKPIQNNSSEKVNYVKADANKVVFKEKIDLLVDIYDVLIKNNLILSVITEINFMISIIVSKQCESDYEEAESNLKGKNLDYLLKSIHNSTYFAVKSLWKQRMILEVILDKSSLKIFGEIKKIRSFYPDLPKFMLNTYGLKCEAEKTQERNNVPEYRSSNGVVCFNLETDNVDNFPSTHSFQSFKKQRDLFYEIHRWYQESETSGGSHATFRARIKPLLSAATSAANHTHLAALFTSHMLAALPNNTKQESKLSKLQRRLTSPASTVSHRLPYFSPQEMFYKEFVMSTDNESFRVHLRDKLASEIIALDSTSFAEDRNYANNSDLPREYLSLNIKLRALSKLLGFLCSLPYCLGGGGMSVVKYQPHIAPKHAVLANELALRNYSQPNIDVQGLLSQAQKNSRLCITLPWLIHYLSMLDYTTLRTNYYQRLIKTLFEIYSNLKFESIYKKNTVIFLKAILGWLFDLPHFPIEGYDRCHFLVVESEMSIDYCNIIDETVLFELCPFLKDVNVLLSTCKVGQEQKESFRHITPVSLTLNPEDRTKNQEKELQSRLEEELLKSQPSSTRRVLELVCERVTSLCVRRLAGALAAARGRARARAARLVRGGGGNLLQSLEAMYAAHTQEVCVTALQSAEVLVRERAASALEALLPHASPPILKLAVSGCLARLHKWITDNWTTTTILCKDIESEMKNLMVLGEHALESKKNKPIDPHALVSSAATFEANNMSPSTSIINLKEQICLLLEYSEPSDLANILSACANSCSPSNVFARLGTNRVLLRLSVELCLIFVCRKPTEVNDNFLNQLNNIWNTCCPDRKRNEQPQSSPQENSEELSPDFRNFEGDERAPTPLSDEDSGEESEIISVIGINSGTNAVKSETNTLESGTNTVKNGSNTVKSDTNTVNSGTNTVDCGTNEVNSGTSDGNKGDSESCDGNDTKTSLDNTVNNIIDEDNNSEMLEYFDRILCPRNIMLFSVSKCEQSEVWDSLATVLVFLLTNDYLSEDSFTEQCLTVYRQDWPQKILGSLSNCMKSVSSRWSRPSTGKFNLFLDFLAEYCGDMDYESSI